MPNVNAWRKRNKKSKRKSNDSKNRKMNSFEQLPKNQPANRNLSASTKSKQRETFIRSHKCAWILLMFGGENPWLKSRSKWNHAKVDYLKGTSLSQWIAKNFSRKRQKPMRKLFKSGNRGRLKEKSHWGESRNNWKRWSQISGAIKMRRILWWLKD